MSERGGRPDLLTVSLALAGLLISVLLTVVHVRVHLDPMYESFCAVGEIFNCEAAASSPYAVVLGVPLSVTGSVFYLLVGVAALARLRTGRPLLAGVSLLLGIGGGCAGVLLFVVSVVQVEALCLLCAVTQVINVLLALLAIRTAAAGGGPAAVLRADVSAARRNPGTAALWGGILGLSFAVGLLGLFPRYWEFALWTGGEQQTGVDQMGRPWIGAARPRTLVVEYFDFDCPACRVAHEKLRQLLGERGEWLRITRHTMPRTACRAGNGRFSDRCAAARAAHCAAREGGFWAFNDAVIAYYRLRGGPPRRGDFELELAARLGFGQARFADCMALPETVDAVQRLYELGRDRKVRVTPSYEVDGEMVVGLGGVMRVLNRDAGEE